MSQPAVALARVLKLETVSVEEPTGYDQDDAPTYGTAANIDVRPLRMDETILSAAGEEEKTTLKVLVPPGTTPMPANDWRLTYSGVPYIVREASEQKRMRTGNVAHVRLRCREEGA